MAKKKKIESCAFCGHSISEYPNMTLFSQEKSNGDTVYICDDCVQLLYGQLVSGEELIEETPEKKETKKKIPRPDEINKFLDDYVIGQDDAKKILSVAAYNHYKYLHYFDTHEDLKSKNPETIELQKSNCLIVGDSGVGKTESIRALAKFMDVPLAICDCSSLSSTGYVGADPVSVLTELLYRADGDVSLAERGIVFLDEFDKLAKSSSDNKAKDVTGEGVQMELLKIIEGTTVDVPVSPSKKMMSDAVRMDTRNILFICGGAFSGIIDIIADRADSESKKPTLGFGDTRKSFEKESYNETIMKVTTDDFIEYGIMQEMLGRLPVIVPFKQLTKEELIKILTEPKNAIVKQYIELLKMDRAELIFTPGALERIAEEAISRNIGARGLRSILESVLKTAMYELPKRKTPCTVTITDATVKDRTLPEIKNKVRVKTVG